MIQELSPDVHTSYGCSFRRCEVVVTAEPGLDQSLRDGKRMAETFVVSVETIFAWDMGENSLNLVNMRSPQKTGSALKLVASRAEELRSFAILCENAENQFFVVW